MHPHRIIPIPPMNATQFKRAKTAGAQKPDTRVLIVDDHPAIREALTAALADAGGFDVIGEAASAQEALTIFAKSQPDVAVIDISLEDAHGLDLVQNIATQYPEVEVVVYSMYDERVYAERAIRAGASGYVMKKEPTRKVIEAIRTVEEGDIFLSQRIFSRMVGKSTTTRTRGPSFAVDTLTDREMAVFQMLGEGYTLEEVVERLNLSRKTVEAYRRRAKEKLGLRSVGELLQHAIRWVNGHGTV